MQRWEFGGGWFLGVERRRISAIMEFGVLRCRQRVVGPLAILTKTHISVTAAPYFDQDIVPGRLRLVVRLSRVLVNGNVLYIVLTAEGQVGLQRAWDQVLHGIECELSDRWGHRRLERSSHGGRGGNVSVRMVKLEWKPPRRRVCQTSQVAALQVAARWLRHGRSMWQQVCVLGKRLMAANVACSVYVGQTSQLVELLCELNQFYVKIGRASETLDMLDVDLAQFLARGIAVWADSLAEQAVQSFLDRADEASKEFEREQGAN
ncbi:unnamed protein product, partial [Prorocentrum cordatum]